MNEQKSSTNTLAKEGNQDDCDEMGANWEEGYFGIVVSIENRFGSYRGEWRVKV